MFLLCINFIYLFGLLFKIMQFALISKNNLYILIHRSFAVC